MSWHSAFSIESLPVDNKFALFAQLGYHKRGSAIRQNAFVGINRVTGAEQRYSARTTRFEFSNIVLSLGGKQKFNLGESAKYFYLFGLRGEYTVNTNLGEFDELQSRLYFPVNEFVQKWNYGIIIGGGMEFMFSELMGVTFEVTYSPDFSNQYNQPPIQNVINPWTRNPENIPEKLIKNNTIELTVGFRFLRKVEYVD